MKPEEKLEELRLYLSHVEVSMFELKEDDGLESEYEEGAYNSTMSMVSDIRRILNKV